MANPLHQLRAERDYIAACLADIHERTGGDELVGEARTEWDDGVAAVRSYDERIAAEDKRQDEARAFAARTPSAQEPTDAPERSIPNVNVKTDPFDLSDLPRGEARSADLEARAAEVIESHLPKSVTDSAREAATEKAERRSTRLYDADAVREHIIATSSPDYVRGFESYVANPTAGVPAELRAAMSLTGANGGVLVPQFLDPTIVLTNDGTTNDVRRIAGQASITVDQWDGVTSAGVTAEWLGEGSEAADATPTFTAPTITTHKSAAYLFGSYEVLADSGFDEVGVLIADAFDRLEATAFTTGTGSSEPYGLITQLSGTGPVVAGTSGAAGAADFVAADVYALDDNLGARWRTNASFLAAKATYNDVRQLGTSDTYHAFWTSFGGGIPAELIGYPTYQAEDMDSTIVSGSNDYVLLLGDFMAGYKIVDRVGTSIAYNPLVVGSNQRPTGQAGWFAFKRCGADVITSNAFKLLKV